MLFYQTIDATTLELLKNLQSNKSFEHMFLVGGTSLALQIGHRVSIGIDLFGKMDIVQDELNNVLSSFGEVIKIQQTKNINIYTINGIKTDIVNYTYPWLNKPICTQGLKLASKEDIAAMKLSAITGRGSKKDFIDLYFLLQTYTLKEMLSFYEKKYSDGSLFMVLRSLSYFDEANEDVMPRMLINTTWKAVKEKIILELKKLL